MEKSTLKTILYAAFGYVIAAIFSFACYYTLINIFAFSTAAGGCITAASIVLAYLLVNHTEFIGEYEEVLDY